MPTVRATTQPSPIMSVWTLSFIVLALLIMLVVAGLPGKDRAAGDGSDKLRHGWARKQAEAATQQPAQPAPTDAPAH